MYMLPSFQRKIPLIWARFSNLVFFCMIRQLSILLSVKSNFTFCLIVNWLNCIAAMLCDWLKNILLLYQPIRSTCFPVFVTGFLYLLQVLIGSLVCQHLLWFTRVITLVLVLLTTLNQNTKPVIYFVKKRTNPDQKCNFQVHCISLVTHQKSFTGSFKLISMFINNGWHNTKEWKRLRETTS